MSGIIPLFECRNVCKTAVNRLRDNAVIYGLLPQSAIARFAGDDFGERQYFGEGAKRGAPRRIERADALILALHGDPKSIQRIRVGTPVTFVTVTEINDPIGRAQRIVALAVRPRDTGINAINAVAEMLRQFAVETVVVRQSSGIEDGQIIGGLVMLDAAHQRGIGAVAQPCRWEMIPVIYDVFQAGLVDGIANAVVLRPIPFARLALDGAPRDIILISDKPLRLHFDQSFGTRRRLQNIRPGKRANR